MKTIASQFDGRADQRAFQFKLLGRQGRLCLFEKVNRTTGFRSWEVVFVQERFERTWPDGRITPAHEGMPGSELWGAAGWSLPTLERARAKFDELAEARQTGLI